MTMPEKVLQKAKGLVEIGWCQGAMARDKAGKEIRQEFFGFKLGATYCIVGAVIESCPETEFQMAVLRKLLPDLQYTANRGVISYLTQWNDGEGMTKERVLEVIDSAIERERARAKRGPRSGVT